MLLFINAFMRGITATVSPTIDLSLPYLRDVRPKDSFRGRKKNHNQGSTIKLLTKCPYFRLLISHDLAHSHDNLAVNLETQSS